MLDPLKKQPLVSIIIPSFNQGAYIRETLDSCFDQDYRPIEIIVMDGGSTDNTVEILESFGTRPELFWISEKDRGVVDAVNKGLIRAKGEICAIQSSDDVYLPGAVRNAVEAFARAPDAGLVYGDVKSMDASGRIGAGLRQTGYSLERLLRREIHIPQPAAFFRLDLARKLGGWDDRIPYVPDTDLWIRIAFRSSVVKLDEFLACLRKHPDQRDRMKDRIYQDYMRMLDQSADLVAAPSHLRRAARAGAKLLKLRYGGPWTDAQLTNAVWRAVLLHPPLLISPVIPLHRKIPGYFAFTRLLRVLRGKPKRGA